MERQIAALNNSTNRDDIAQRLQLQSQLADAKDELYELQYDHEIEQRKMLWMMSIMRLKNPNKRNPMRLTRTWMHRMQLSINTLIK